MHLAPLIRDLAIILAVAGLMTLFFQRIRQPVVLGYILAGVIVGPHTRPFHMVSDIPSIQTWAELGVIFLMFTLGLEFSFRKLARVGVPAAVTAGSEVLFFIPVGFLVGKLFGWGTMDSLFLGAMLSISSTTIIIKALEELKLKTHKFAELIFAALIVEDLIAILLLVALTTIAVSKTVSALALLTAALKLILVVGGWFIAGYAVVPRFMRYVGQFGNREMLTIVSLGFCLTLVVFANHFHYSTALGAFIMGSILAESAVLHRIEESMSSLKDLFGAVFFVSIGMLIDPALLWQYRLEVVIICIVTVIGKILSTSFGALVSGQSLKNSVQVGFGLAQIGEFSFIIASLGVSLKVTSDFIYPIGVAVSLVTTFTTPYMIKASASFAGWLESKLPARAKELLNRYAKHAEERRSASDRRKGGSLPALKWALNGLTASVIFVSSVEWFLPYLVQRSIFKESVAPLWAWGAAMLLASPFIWAMFTVYGGIRDQRVWASLGSKAATLFWIAGLSSEFFPGHYVLGATTIALLAGFGIFYRRLEDSYRWFERRFLSTFETEEELRLEPVMPFSHLAPWDAHLIKTKVDPNAAIVGKRITDAALRVRYGVNIVAIQRGRSSIVTPLPEERIMPWDELIVLGTDEQVERMQPEFDAPEGLEEQIKSTSSYELKQMKLDSGSPFAGQTIRQSGIREHFRLMVVGVEREGRRFINPDSDLRLQNDDVLWIAGEKKQLDGLFSRKRVE